MRQAGVDDVRLLHARLDRLDGAADLGQHAAVDDAPANQVLHLAELERGEDRVWVLPVFEQPGHIGKKNKFARLEALGDGSRGFVRVDVVELAVRPLGEGGDDGGDPGLKEGLDRFDIHAGDIADIAPVHLLPGFRILLRVLRAGEDVITVDAPGFAAERFQFLDDLLIHFVVEDLLDDADGILVGDPEALLEDGPEAGFLHPLGNRLAAAVDQHGPEADALHERDVLEHVLDALGVFHGAAAKLNDDGIAPEPLDIGQGLDQDIGFFNDFLHGVLSRSRAHTYHGHPHASKEYEYDYDPRKSTTC